MVTELSAPSPGSLVAEQVLVFLESVHEVEASGCLQTKKTLN